jgi:hypothetical protein
MNPHRAALWTEAELPADALDGLHHSAELSATPARWDRPSMPLGTHQAAWV